VPRLPVHRSVTYRFRTEGQGRGRSKSNFFDLYVDFGGGAMLPTAEKEGPSKERAGGGAAIAEALREGNWRGVKCGLSVLTEQYIQRQLHKQFIDLHKGGIQCPICPNVSKEAT
jgi:hypothetical protein